jgi:hypothetical protein
MSPLGKKTAVSSLDALRRKVTLDALAGLLQPLLLLQMLGGVSQTVSSSVSRSRSLARTLLLSGQERLRDLLANAPRLRLPLERVLARRHADDAERTPEEIAAQALLELCLGLLLQWMAEQTHRPCTRVVLSRRQRMIPPHFFSFSSSDSPRARSGPHLLLA